MRQPRTSLPPASFALLAAALAAPAGAAVTLADPADLAATTVGLQRDVVLSPLARLAATLVDADLLRRAEFARVALEELALDYAAEAAQATDRRGGGRWSAQTARYADELSALATRIESASAVDIELDPSGIVNLIVDGQRVILSGPRLDDPYRYELAVLAAWCELEPCDQAQERLPPTGEEPPEGLAQADGVGTPGPDAQPFLVLPEGHWSFQQARGPTWVGPHGLSFAFGSAEDLRAKAKLAERLTLELLALADALRQAQAVRGALDWSAICLLAEEGGRQGVGLGEGSRLLLPLPLLARTPALWEQVRPWLRARVEGREDSRTLHGLEPLLAAPEGGEGLERPGAAGAGDLG